MKQSTFISIILLSTVGLFAVGSFAQPESYVPTPVEKSEISQESPKLGDKESANWQKMRAERKLAREQILSKLRESSRMEKKSIRTEVSQKRNEKSHTEGPTPKINPHEKGPGFERPDAHNQNPMRDKPVPGPKGDPKHK